MARAYGEAGVPIGRHGLAADVVAEQQRERLFSATVELVARQGYRGTSIDQIVRSAQVGDGAFYGLFDGKEDCLLAALDRIVGEGREALAAAVADEDEWPQQLAAALGRLIGLVVERPERARLLLVEAPGAGPAARALYERAFAAALEPLRAGRAVDPQAARLSPTLEEAVLGGVVWAIHQRLVEGDLGRPEQLLEETLQIALSPYVGD